MLDKDTRKASNMLPDAKDNVEPDKEDNQKSCFQSLFNFGSARWQKALKVKDFLLSVWMLFDILMDVVTCVGFYTMWQVSFYT